LWIYHGWGTSQIQTSSMRRCNFKSQAQLTRLAGFVNLDSGEQLLHMH
jgi:hypothetical protein